jgi:hypothetical protein
MKAKWGLLCVAWLALAGCASSPTPPPAVTVDASSPPNTKEVLRHLMRNLDVPLTVDSSCKGVGTTDDDLTIGDYLSGFLAEHAKEDGQNWLEVTTVPAATPDGSAAWECRVMVRRRDAEDVMGWGAGFLVTATDRAVVRQSFRCLGGG